MNARNTYLGHAITGFGSLIKSAIYLLMALSLLYFLWGVAVFIFKAGDKNAREAGREHIKWGLLALFVLVAVGSLINLLQRTVGVPLTP